MTQQIAVEESDTDNGRVASNTAGSSSALAGAHCAQVVRLDTASMTFRERLTAGWRNNADGCLLKRLVNSFDSARQLRYAIVCGQWHPCSAYSWQLQHAYLLRCTRQHPFMRGVRHSLGNVGQGKEVCV